MVTTALLLICNVRPEKETLQQQHSLSNLKSSKMVLRLNAAFHGMLTM
jgi:hypothetical protein